MGYPRSLDEYSDEELRKEIERRAKKKVPKRKGKRPKGHAKICKAPRWEDCNGKCW